MFIGDGDESSDMFLNEESEGGDDNDDDLHDTSSGNEMVDIQGWKADLFVGQQEEDFVLYPKQVPDGKEICTINKVDFSHLVSDEVYESLLVDEPQVANSCGSDPGNACNNGTIKPLKSSKDDPIEKDDLQFVRDCCGLVPGDPCNSENSKAPKSCREDSIDATVKSCSGSIPCAGEIAQGTDVVLYSDSINQQHEDSFATCHYNSTHEVICSANEGIHYDLNNRPMASLPFIENNMRENSVDIFVARNVAHNAEDSVYMRNMIKDLDEEQLKTQNESVANFECKDIDDTAETISSVHSGLEAAPQVGEELVDLTARHCETISADNTLKSDVMTQSTSEAAQVIRIGQNSETRKRFCSTDSLARTAWENFFKKRTRDGTYNSGVCKLRKSPEPFLEAAPQVGMELVDSAARHCETISKDHTSKSDVMIQSTSEAAQFIRIGQNSETRKSFCSSDSLAKTAWENFVKKRMRDRTCDSRACKLQKSPEPFLEAKVKSEVTSKCTFAASDLGNETIAGNSTVAKAYLLVDSSADATPDVEHPATSSKVDRGYNPKASCDLEFDRHILSQRSHLKKRPYSTDPSNGNWIRYSFPLETISTKSNRIQCKPTVTKKIGSHPKLLHMKFPKDFKLPTEEELQENLKVFGPLDCSQTKVFFYTGAAQVAFLHSAHAAAAYKYVKRTNIFGDANVRFWFDHYETSRKRHIHKSSSAPLKRTSSSHKRLSPKRNNSLDQMDGGGKCITSVEKMSPVDSSALGLKSCLRSPDTPGKRDKNAKVRFTIATPCR